jgi:Mor family transcriptional regulator
MIFSKDVICEICKEIVPTLGLHHHIKKHGLDYTKYKNEFVYKHEKCPVCGNPVILPRKYCSIRCANYQRNYTRSSYILSETEEKELISFYSNGASIETLYKKFKVSIERIKKILNKYNIKRHTIKETVDKNNKNRALIFLESNIGKTIISEYQKFGCSLKGLEKKYGISKKSIKKLLILKGFKIKTKEESLNEVRAQNKILGIRNHNFGKPPAAGSGKCFWYLYEGIKYQGSWEFKFGLWLKAKKIDFLCHTGMKRFEYVLNGSSYTYHPDFYLPKEGCYIEIKGYFPKEAQEKMTAVKRCYPDIVFNLYDKNILAEKDILNIDKKLNIHIEDYQLDHKTDDLCSKEFLKKVDMEKLIKEKVIEHRSIIVLAKQYNIPYSVMRRVCNSIPRPGTDEFYSFCLKKFFNSDHIKIIKTSISSHGAARQINNGLARNRKIEIIKRFRQGFLCL